MVEKEKEKIILGNLLSQILEDESNLEGFAFFVNRLENIRRPVEEIQSILNDYFSICNGLPVKAKGRVKHIADRHVLHCNKNIGYIDADKIEIISNAVLDKTGIKYAITIHDFKRRYKNNILRNDEFLKPYKELMKEYQEGDEIFEMISPCWTWKQLCGRSAVVLIRDDEFIIGIKKSMN